MRGENWTWKELMMRNLRRSVYSLAHTAASAVYEIDDVQHSVIYAPTQCDLCTNTV